MRRQRSQVVDVKSAAAGMCLVQVDLPAFAVAVGWIEGAAAAAVIHCPQTRQRPVVVAAVVAGSVAAGRRNVVVTGDSGLCSCLAACLETPLTSSSCCSRQQSCPSPPAAVGLDLASYASRDAAERQPR